MFRELIARGSRRLCRAAPILCTSLLFALALPETARAVKPGEVTHVILVSLQRPGNVNDRNVLERAARSLRRARGVSDFRIGRALNAAGSRATEPFDFAIVVTFRNERALQRFTSDRRRQDALEGALASLVRRRVTYDFVNE